MYGHIQKLAEAEKKGVEAAGGEATIFQYGDPETFLTPLACVCRIRS